MTEKQLIDRIELRSDVLVGKPVIRGTRLSVEFVLGLLAQGTTVEEILAEYEGLGQLDVQACMLYAAKSLEKTVILPLAG